MTEKHVPIERVELGYARRICALCATDWPCPPYVALRESTQPMRDAYYAAKLSIDALA